MSKIETVTFYNGNKVPLLGLGTAAGKNGIPVEVIKHAIRFGYRHIDTSPIYGSQKEIGEAIADLIKEGAVKREELFVTSKLWNTRHRPDLVEPSLKKTLAELQLDYLDLYLIHTPIGLKEVEGDDPWPKGPDGKLQYSDVDYLDTWKAMEEVQKKGLAKNIGVSNFNSKQITRIIENCEIKPVTNQVECHPYLSQVKLSEFCKSKGILLTAYSPLGSRERPWAKPEDPSLLDDPKIKAIAEKHNKTPAQVVLRFQVQRGHIVIPKSSNKNRLEENARIFDFELSQEEFQELTSFNRNWRVCTFNTSKEHKDYPFNEEF